MGNLFLDLDGTIINCRRRLYDLFAELVPHNDLSCDDYWGVKRGGLRQEDLLRNRLNLNESQISSYKTDWLAHIEDEERLAADIVIPGIPEFIQNKAENNFLHLVTNRQYHDRVLKQLGSMRLAHLFQNILVTEQRISKAGLIKKNGIKIKVTDAFIGDTGEDILTARELGCRSVAVSWGFLSEICIASYQPDFIANKVEDLVQCPLI